MRSCLFLSVSLRSLEFTLQIQSEGAVAGSVAGLQAAVPQSILSSGTFLHRGSLRISMNDKIIFEFKAISLQSFFAMLSCLLPTAVYGTIKGRSSLAGSMFRKQRS